MLFEVLGVLVAVTHGFQIDSSSNMESWKQPRQFPYYPVPLPRYSGYDYYPPTLNNPMIHPELGMSPLYRDLVLNYIYGLAGKGPVKYYDNHHGFDVPHDSLAESEVPINEEVDLNVLPDQMSPSDVTLQRNQHYVDYSRVKTKHIGARYPNTLPMIGGVVSDYIINVEKETSPEESNRIDDDISKFIVLKSQPYVPSEEISVKDEENPTTVQNEPEVTVAEESKVRRRRFSSRQFRVGDLDDDEDVVVHADPSRKHKNDKQDQPEQTEEEQPAIAQSKPSAIALAGPGGVAQASPVGTALVGPGGIAVASPSGTAVAGPGTAGAVQVASSDEKIKVNTDKEPVKKQQIDYK